MKRVFLLMVVSALLVTWGFAQTPDVGSNTDPANVKGCLGGSDANYTVAEDGTRQIFKITSSTVDLKPHLGHDVKLTGHRASGTVSSGAADSFAVTELSMISEHCVAAAAAPVATVIPPSETVIAPVPDAAAPAATVNPAPAIVSTPTADPAAPAATVNPSPAIVSTPTADPAASAATVNPSAATASAPAANAAHPTRPSAHARRSSATQAAAASVPAATVSRSADTVIPTAADAGTPAATASPLDTVSTPAPAATTTAVTHRGGSLWLLVSFVVLVIVLGTLAPLLGRWRKRKMLERTGTPNLSFTKEASSHREKLGPRKVA
jgi:hypothetical protein